MADTFEQIWEQDARWLMGPSVLGDIVQFLRGKPLEAVFDQSGHVSITLPLPTVRNEISGEQVPIFFLVPDELKELFLARCQLVLDQRARHVLQRIEPLLNRADTPSIRAAFSAELQAIERDAEMRGEADLSALAAESFGLSNGAWDDLRGYAATIAAAEPNIDGDHAQQMAAADVMLGRRK